MGLQRFASRLVVAGSLALAVSACATTKSRDEADYHQRIGTALLSQGHYPDALRELLLAEKLDPKSSKIQNNLGLAFFMRERLELSEKHLARAIELEPSYSEARNNYGRLLVEEQKFPQAIVQLKRVIADLTYPEPAKAWVNLGLAHFRSNDFTEAKNDFAQAIKINREDCYAQNMFGRSLFELGMFNEAAPALDNAILVCKSEKLEEPHYFSGLTYYKLGRTSEAISRMEEVISLYPESRYAKKAESLLQIMK